MKRQAAQAVTCARCAALVTLDAEHCGICWWPVSAAIPTEPTEATGQVEEVEEAESTAEPFDPVEEPVIEPADDYITEQIPVVLVAAAGVNGRPAQVWAPLPGTPLPGPNPFGTTFTG